MPMQKHAWIFIFATFLLTVLAALYIAVNQLSAAAPTGLFLYIVVTATLMRLFVIEGPQHRSYEASTIILFASILLLNEWQFILVVTISFAVEWAKQRYTNSTLLRSWYVQPFNMAKTILGGLSVYLLIERYEQWGSTFDKYTNIPMILAAIGLAGLPLIVKVKPSAQ